MELLIQTLQIGNEEHISKGLVKFFTEFGNSTTLQDSLAVKQKLVENLFRIVRDSNRVCLYATTLQVIRILTRDNATVDTLFTNDRIETLLHLAMLVGEEEAFMTENSQSFDSKIVVESQKCLSNLIALSPLIRRTCGNNSCIDGIMLRLRMHPDPKLPYEVKYFDMLMLFFLTAYCSELRPRIRDDYHGLIYLMEAIDLILKNNAEYLAENMPYKSKRRSKGSRRGRKGNQQPQNSQQPQSQSNESDSQTKITEEVTESMSDLHIDDTLVAYCLDDWEVNLSIQVIKVLFNLTMNIDSNTMNEFEEAHFFRLVSILHDLLLCDTRNESKKEDLQSHIVNLLINMPPQSYEELLSKIAELGKPENPEHEYLEMNLEVVASLLDFLKKRLDNEDKSNALERLAPILQCLIRACDANSIIRKYVRYQILPPLKDVQHRPEVGNTMRNKLVRLMTSPNVNLKHLVAHFLFILCKGNASRLIKYTGYGNAAGLLASLGLMKTDSKLLDYSSDSEDSETEEYTSNIEKINPVIGCIQKKESNPLDEMTEEQKEYEANRLVNAIDQLQRTGIIQPCKIGEDGRPQPVEHILQLQERESFDRSAKSKNIKQQE
ncbi:Synembryn-A [Sarcoptes scabiei]|uniref:Synembryn-A n=1 Tax=Sarcoptes scabiei TaxID=52283 RepID=A0A131ZUQ2_SARSC|nr:Synembryn-A [Sarcoptes scabiei]KPM02522.1 synembryn-A-like protein [Sarcoptes scabiei]